MVVSVVVVAGVKRVERVDQDLLNNDGSMAFQNEKASRTPVAVGHS